MAKPNRPRASRRKERPVPQTASAVILDGMRTAILSGKYPPGARIGQEEIGSEYGVSRLPVREALRELENEGLVTLRAHSGARVAHFDLHECVEIYRLREVVEPLLIEDAGPRLTPEDLDEIGQLADAIEQSAEDRVTWLILDREFHLAVHRATHMHQGLELIQRLWNQTQHFRRAHIIDMDPSELEIVHMEHRLIVDALRRGDFIDAAQRGGAHIRRTRVDLLKRAELDPDFLS